MLWNKQEKKKPKILRTITEMHQNINLTYYLLTTADVNTEQEISL
jgi:hypothetical protein